MHVQIKKRRKTLGNVVRSIKCSQHITTKGHDKFEVSDVSTVQAPGQNKQGINYIRKPGCGVRHWFSFSCLNPELASWFPNTALKRKELPPQTHLSVPVALQDGEFEIKLHAGLEHSCSNFSSIRIPWITCQIHRLPGLTPRVFDAEGLEWGPDNLHF